MDNVSKYKSDAKARFNRNIATEWRGKVYNISPCLPSELAIDTQLCFQTGIYSKETYLMPIEMVPYRRPIVDAQVSKLTDNYCDVIGVKVHAIKLEKYLDLEKEGEQIDYFPLDICGNIHMQLVRWFFLYQEYFADEMRFPITMQALNKRDGYNFDAVNQATNGKYYDFIDKLTKQQATEFHFANGMPTPTTMESIYSQLYLIYCSMPDKELLFKSVNVYNNADEVEREEGQKGKLAEDMVLVDVEVKDNEYRNCTLGKLKKVVNCYNKLRPKGEPVILAHKTRKKREKKGQTQNRVAFVDMFGIKSRKDLNTDKVYNKILQYSKEHNVQFNHIIGGIERSLTVRAKKKVAK
jgi:hypothetical protein